MSFLLNYFLGFIIWVSYFFLTAVLASVIDWIINQFKSKNKF